MAFIVMLVLTTLAVAGSAAFFSVHGLAQMFKSIPIIVVVMGVSLEAGKLVAASYLYRYWTVTATWLKSYLVIGVAVLMAITSIGIFGVLSAGYQQDSLPLKAKQQQLLTLETERATVYARKVDIDKLLLGAVSVSTLERNGAVDKNAIKALRESERARGSLYKQYGPEQSRLGARLVELDNKIGELKLSTIESTAHLGPITYIASVLGTSTDNAATYLIVLIILVFDPLAVALTIATNNAIRLRSKQTPHHEEHPATPIPVVEVADSSVVALVTEDDNSPSVAPSAELPQEAEQHEEAPIDPSDLTLVPLDSVTLTPTDENHDETTLVEEAHEPTADVVEAVDVVDVVDPVVPEPQRDAPVVPAESPPVTKSRSKRTPGRSPSGHDQNITTVIASAVQRLRQLQALEDGGTALTLGQTTQRMEAYELLRKHGLGQYMGIR